jgi:hypothetical protein
MAGLIDVGPCAHMDNMGIPLAIFNRPTYKE